MIRHSLLVSIFLMSNNLIGLDGGHIECHRMRKESDASTTSASTSATDTEKSEYNSSEEDIDIKAEIDLATIFINRHQKKSIAIRVDAKASIDKLIELHAQITEYRNITSIRKTRLIVTLRCKEVAEIRDALVAKFTEIIRRYEENMELIAREIPTKDSSDGSSIFTHVEIDTHSEEALAMYLLKSEFFLNFHHSQAEKQIREAAELFEYYEHSRAKLFSIQENLRLYRDIVIDKCTPIEVGLHPTSKHPITDPDVRRILLEVHTKLRHIISAYNQNIATLKRLAR